MSEFYGPPQFERSFEYRGIIVEIYRTIKGAKHCETPHEYDKYTCDICGEQIFPKEIFQVSINGANPIFECESVEDATEAAQSCIDEEGEEDDDEGMLDFPWPKDAPFPGQDNDDLRSNEVGRSDSPGQMGPPGMRLAALIKWMKKLGWGKKAARIANETPEEPGQE